MYKHAKVIVFTIVFVVANISSVLGQTLTDPYAILNRYFEATGGLNRLKAERTAYNEGSISLGGMQGTVKLWAQKPGMNRTEVKLGPLNITQGDNGTHAWVLDQNGKLQIITRPDDATAKRRQVRKLIDEYKYAEQGSHIFTVMFQGIERVETESCYVVKITNNINDDSYTYSINISNFMLTKTRAIEDIDSRDVFYSDYREIDGLSVPFSIKEVPHQTGQTQEIKLTRYESNPKIDTTIFEPPSQIAKDYQFINGDRAENIPFKFIGNHIYLAVKTEGKERLWILDSGAGMSVLNKAFAEELGLTIEGELKGNDASGVITAGFTTLPPYQVGNIQFQNQTVAVIDMGELFRRLGPDVAGILGYDFLSRFITKVDFANKLISFFDPETFSYTGNGHTVEMHFRNSLFNVEATLDGIHSGNWLFDLGASSVSLDGRYALREGYAGKAGVVRKGHGAGNEYQVKEIRGDSIQFAGFTIYKPEISFAYGGTDTTFTADQIGTLGNTLFRHFTLYCDYLKEQLIVEKGTKFNASWPTDRSGLQIAWNNDHEIEVTYVSPGTPAEKAGFKTGDILSSINGIKIKLLDGIVAIREIFKSDPGTMFEIMVNRSQEVKKLKLKLAQLY